MRYTGGHPGANCRRTTTLTNSTAARVDLASQPDPACVR
eukprot:CAMPEP_0204340576 /NCGR_PEP_ID=MMETSP0469-20131031/22683_1 /ASSEMBLY_ACC=CAM_ASM_000384 /TAXON_ID=2969 /ORGANISM="Oxyrrhis marina" /LENGTH=38 /DNA_ID= /DNA_START= /DNA_END= /DNA_ORIENTATION=